MKVKIGAKILISFTVIVSLIILVSFIGLSGINSVNSKYHEIVHVNLPVESLVKEVRSLTLEQVAAVRGYIVYKDESYPELFNNLNAQIEETYNKINEKIQTDQSKDFIKKLKEEHDLYDKGCQNIFNLVRQGKIDEGVKLGEDVRTYVTQIKEITSNWSKWVEDVDANIVDSTEKDIHARVITLFVIVIISLIGSLLCAVYLARSISTPISALTKVAAKVSAGDLTQQVPKIKSRDEIHDLGEAFSAMVQNLRSLIINVNDASQELVASGEELAASSEEVTNVSEQIATAVSELAKGASDQAVSAEKGNYKIKEMVDGLSKIAQDMAHSDKMAEKARDVVKIGEDSVKYQEAKVNENVQMSAQVACSITDLSEKSNQIGQILDVIRGIADQTNLLALNAAIEAARAGEAGKGFSVVADEIRKLAEQSGSSVRQIGDIIKDVQSSVDSAVAQMDKSKSMAAEQTNAINETIRVFSDISSAVTAITENIKLVSESSDMLSKNAIQAGDAIADIASIAQETAASSEELAASTEEQTSTMHQIAQSAENLSDLANKLQAGVNKFIL